MNAPRLLSLIPSLILLAATGCAPTLRVNVLEPSQVSLGAGTQLNVLQTGGRRSAREFVLQELGQQAMRGGYFQVKDRSEEGFNMNVAGRSVQFLEGSSDPLPTPQDVALRIDVLDWNANSDSHTNADGVTKSRWRARVVLGVTAANAEGKAMLAESEYVGEAFFEDTRHGGGEQLAIEQAARNAVARLLWDVTPIYVTKHIRIDEDDKAQQPILEVAKQGNLVRAIEELRGYLAQAPGNAVAHYNLAVMLDATGQYDEALSLYTKAIQLSSKAFYVQMKAECARRQAAQMALSN
jgi:hypothetical protein